MKILVFCDVMPYRWVVSDVLNDLGAFIFKVNQSIFFNCLTLKSKSPLPSETSGTVYPTPQHNIAEDLNLQKHRS